MSMTRRVSGRAGGLTLLVLLVQWAGCVAPQPRVTLGERPEWSLAPASLDPLAARLTVGVHEQLAWVQALRTQIYSVAGPRTVENTLVPYQQLLMHLDAARGRSQVLQDLHPDADVRAAAARAEQLVARTQTDVLLDPKLHGAVAAVDPVKLDAATRRFVERTLAQGRRAGVERSEPDRRLIAALHTQLVRLGYEYTRNVEDDVRHVDLPDDRLAGLPDEWFQAHPPTALGQRRVTTQPSDYEPVMQYADDSNTRRELYRLYRSRGYPANEPVLKELLERREQLAQLLGYANWADYATADKMAGSADAVVSFLQRCADVSAAAAEREYEWLLEELRKRQPEAESVAPWDWAYALRLSGRSDGDTSSVLPRGDFATQELVAQTLALTGELFGIEYRPATDAKTWHADVQVYDVYDGPQQLGRVYLDLYERPGKSATPRTLVLRQGVAGLRYPQVVIVAGFPGPAGSDVGRGQRRLADLLHELGHALHHVFAGRQPWIGLGAANVEWDFAEVPALMLEAYAWDTDALQWFAAEGNLGPTPGPLPGDTRRWDRALRVRETLFKAMLALELHRQTADEVDADALVAELQGRYSLFPHDPQTHLACNFRHLVEYSALYYSYLWSAVVAQDLQSAFERGLMDPATAQRFRRQVLEPGASKPAAELVRDFLGRDFRFEAFERQMGRDGR